MRKSTLQIAVLVLAAIVTAQAKDKTLEVVIPAPLSPTVQAVQRVFVLSSTTTVEADGFVHSNNCRVVQNCLSTNCLPVSLLLERSTQASARDYEQVQIDFVEKHGITTMRIQAWMGIRGGLTWAAKKALSADKITKKYGDLLDEIQKQLATAEKH
jgi:hypothetical protein